MDCSTIDHSDSDSGDSWTLIENNSTYADDAPDKPDHPSDSITADNHDKDEDTDGISIITDSEPESSSPCQISYEHYLSEENSTLHHIPQFITVNSDLHDINNHHESEKEDDDFLRESGGKHKTYVHRRNKRLSTVLNIIMLGSVITAAGVAIGHMWGAKTDCSMHTSTNVNKILSNLYKLQEENAYLWSKLKELTALNNYQMNQQKTTLKQNKCKKIFEEPLINNDSKKVTKCVDDKFLNNDKLTNSHMVEAAKKQKSDEFLNETEDLTNERKTYADSLKNFEKVESFNMRENKVLKSGNKNFNENNKLPKRLYNSDIDSSLNDINKLKGDHGYEINLSNKIKNTNMDFNRLRGEHNFYDDFMSHDRHHNVKKRENNRTLREENKDHKEFLKDMKDKKGNKRERNKVFQKKYKDLDKSKIPKNEFGSEEEFFRSMEHRKNKKDKIKGNKIFQMENKDYDKPKEPKTEYKEENLLKNMNDKILFKNQREKNKGYKTKDFDKNQTPTEELKKEKNLKENKVEDKNSVKAESKDFDMSKTSKDEKSAEKMVTKINGESDNQIDSSEEDFKKYNRYIGPKQKQTRKKYDRQQLYKKIKKRNKYQQWEMKGGLLKDYDEISWSSSQDKDYLFNELNLKDDKLDKRQLGDNNIDSDIDTTADNLNHVYFIDDLKSTKITNNKEDEINWLDKRARFRKEARQKLEQESFGKNGVNAAGWYFRRMRKREQSRGNDDNSTYRKLLKRNMNLN